MAVFSYTTDPNEDVGLQFVTDRANADRAAQTPPLPALKPEEYLALILASVLASYVQQAKQQDVEEIKATLETASPAKREAIKKAAMDAAK